MQGLDYLWSPNKVTTSKNQWALCMSDFCLIS